MLFIVRFCFLGRAFCHHIRRPVAHAASWPLRCMPAFVEIGSGRSCAVFAGRSFQRPTRLGFYFAFQFRTFRLWSGG